MAVTHVTGPLISGPSNGAVNPANNTAIPITPDIGPQQFFAGYAIVDPRFGYRGGGGTENNALLSVGIGLNANFSTLDQAPSTAVVNNIAAAVATTSGTTMALVSTSGAGVTVLAAALTIPQTGNTIASGKLAIDLAPALVLFGTNKSTGIADPTKNLSRALSITASSGAVGGVFIIAGADLYGYPQTEKLTVASSPSGATTTNGKKAFKFVNSVTPQVTDTKSYSVGTQDVFGFPVRVDNFTYVDVGFAGSIVASSAGFVAAVSTVASNTTGDVRGTYATQAVTDGVKTLQFFQTISPANVQTMTGYFGVTPA